MKLNRESYLLRVIVLVIGLLIFGGMLLFANQESDSVDEDINSFIGFDTGRIVSILEDDTFMDTVNPDLRLGSMLFEVEMLRGPHQGETLEAYYFLSSLASLDLQVGDRVSVRTNNLNGEIINVEINNIERTELLVGFVILFLIVLSVIGGKRGIMSVIGLIFTMASIVFLLIPLMLRGFPVILTTIGVLSLVTVVVLVLLGGVTPKTTSAALGCIVGVVIAAVLAGLAGSLAQINGMNMEDVGSLLFAAERNGLMLQPNGLFISGVLIASLGAVMDTAISITSALEEIQIANPKITANQLFKSGMGIGRDAMGTMSNTLILAFVGTSLNMTMFMYADNTPFNQMINNDFIAVELIRSVAGSLGIVLTVPAVAFIGSRFFTTWNTKKEEG